MMDGEIKSFFKVWAMAIASLCYCYFIAARIPKGILRLICLIPVFYLFVVLPLNLHSFHLGAPTAFFLAWLGNFKLLLFSINLGPLSSPLPNLLHFISVAMLPIKIKLDPSQKTKIKANPSHQNSQKSAKSPGTRAIPLPIKAVLLALIIRIYDLREHLHPYLILALYCCHMYLALELILALSAVPARAIFGLELEPQFNEPYLTTSLQDFWGRRWNLMVPSILRSTVYNPIRNFSSPVIGPTWAKILGMVGSFAVSGLMHELMYFYFTRVDPTWEVTWFFVLHGIFTAIEVAAKRVAAGKFRLHPAVSRLLTIGFLAVTGNWLFFPQLLRNGVDKKAISEYPVMVNIVKDRLPLAF